MLCGHNRFEHIEEIKPIKTLTLGPKGVMEEITALDRKKKVERKLMLESLRPSLILYWLRKGMLSFGRRRLNWAALTHWPREVQGVMGGRDQFFMLIAVD